MRISRLSERTGVPVATIKYYVREGLLAAPVTVGYNKTEYDACHEARLRMVRALLEVGGLSIAAARDVFAAMDDPELSPFDTAAAAQRAMAATEAPPTDESLRRIWDLAHERGWVSGETPASLAHLAYAPGFADAARILDRYRVLGREDLEAILPAYVEAAEIAAASEVETALKLPVRDRLVETVIVGTILGDHLIAGLRRIAQGAQTAKQLGLTLPATPHTDHREPLEETS